MKGEPELQKKLNITVNSSKLETVLAPKPGTNLHDLTTKNKGKDKNNGRRSRSASSRSASSRPAQAQRKKRPYPKSILKQVALVTGQRKRSDKLTCCVL